MQKINLILSLLLVFGITACQTTPSEPVIESGVSQKLAQFRKQNLEKVTYRLHFSIPEAKQESLKGKAEIAFRTKNASAFVLDFKADPQQIDSVTLNGKTAAYRFANEHILLDAPAFKASGDTVAVYFTCSDQSLNRREEYLYTLLVPDRARTLFPCFDQPDLKAVYQLSLDIPETWKAVANGKLMTENNDPVLKRTRLEFNETEPLSTYLFSFVAGKLTRETFQRENRYVTIYHRESDPYKVAQCPGIAQEVFDALDWMEEYTGIPYPFEKYDMIILPGFQFGGMEHTGATLYNDRIFLNRQATLNERLNRSSLIAHETTHMWFGDYVTMEWFDDVWTKEVFANYFASKMVEPHFPMVNHRLNFITGYVPGAYGEDHTQGSNPIKQKLDNLQNAGLVYGNIIYNKSPIVMEMLANLMGESAFQEGLREYLHTYAYSNATWEGLIEILDRYTPADLKTWSHSWVNEKGLPMVKARIEQNKLMVTQEDPWGRGLAWPQQISYLIQADNRYEEVNINFEDTCTTAVSPVHMDLSAAKQITIIPNIDSRAYGIFRLEDTQQAAIWQFMLQHNTARSEDEVMRGSLLINLYENLRERTLNPEQFRHYILEYISREKNQLLYSLALNYLNNCQRWFLTETETVEEALWNQATEQEEKSFQLQSFRHYRSLATSPAAVERLYQIWKHQEMPTGLPLSESDYMNLAYVLSVHYPDRAQDILKEQKERIDNPDRKKEFEYVSAAVSPIQAERDRVFSALLQVENRSIEPWAEQALSLLNHRLREQESVKYIRPALEKMEEIQRTGDIFFPRAWARALLRAHTSPEAAQEVKAFFEAHPDYPLMLANKIKQQADHLRIN